MLSLDLGNGRKDGDDEFSGILGGVDSILDTDKMDAIVLHQLKGGQDIGGISSKA